MQVKYVYVHVTTYDVLAYSAMNTFSPYSNPSINYITTESL